MRRTDLRIVGRVVPYPSWRVRTGNASRTDIAIAIAPFLLLIAAIVSWATSLHFVDLSTMNDLGLISVLPPGYFFSLILLTFAFCLVLRYPPLRSSVLLLHIAVLILILYGTPALVEQTPRFAVTWRHLGLVDYVLHHGKVLPRFSAYFDWPGFFTFGAFVTRIAGVPSLVNLAAWASLLFNLLYLIPLVVIYRSSARNNRLVWIAIWFFYLANWVGQDYFSPQGFAYFFYLAVLAILLGWYRGRSFGAFHLESLWTWFQVRLPRVTQLVVGEREEALPWEASPWQRVGLIAIAIAAFAAMVPSHQLTPFAALLAVCLLTAFNQTRTRTLPIILAVLVLAWLVFMATPYLTGHLAEKVSTVGTVDQNVQHGVAGRVHGSPGHMFVVHLRLVMTGAIALMALGGFCRWLVSGHRDLSIALIGIAPIPMLLAQYGGEMFLRVYFYALPGMAFFAAVLVCPNLHLLRGTTGSPESSETGASSPRRLPAVIPFRPSTELLPSWWSIVSIGLVSLVLLEGFLITRYGNERMDYFTAQEVEAVRYLYSVAPPGSLLEAPGISVPWQFEGFASYRTKWVGNKVVENADIPALEQTMSANDRGDYILITRSVEATLELYDGLSPDVLPRFEQALIASGRFIVIYQNSDARVYMFLSSPIRVGPR